MDQSTSGTSTSSECVHPLQLLWPQTMANSRLQLLQSVGKGAFGKVRFKSTE